MKTITYDDGFPDTYLLTHVQSCIDERLQALRRVIEEIRVLRRSWPNPF